MSGLIKKDDVYKALSGWDWQDLYLPIHFKEMIDEIPFTQDETYTEQNVRDAYTDGYSDGIHRGYEDAVRNYREMLKKYSPYGKCQFPEGVVIKPDGLNELDPCIYEEVEVIENCTVRVLRCKRCGHIEVEWERNGSQMD